MANSIVNNKPKLFKDVIKDCSSWQISVSLKRPPVGASADAADPAEAADGVAESMLTSYDQLDFSRPSRELKHHYHSTSTLKSVKSSGESKHLIEVPDLRKERHLSTGDYIDASAITVNPQTSSLGQLSKGDIPKVGWHLHL